MCEETQISDPWGVDPEARDVQQTSVVSQSMTEVEKMGNTAQLGGGGRRELVITREKWNSGKKLKDMKPLRDRG
eukprot:747973-Hanusia_phi.AAC.2